MAVPYAYMRMVRTIRVWYKIRVWYRTMVHRGIKWNETEEGTFQS